MCVEFVCCPCVIVGCVSSQYKNILGLTGVTHNLDTFVCEWMVCEYVLRWMGQVTENRRCFDRRPKVLVPFIFFSQSVRYNRDYSCFTFCWTMAAPLWCCRAKSSPCDVSLSCLAEAVIVLTQFQGNHKFQVRLHLKIRLYMFYNRWFFLNILNLIQSK